MVPPLPAAAGGRGLPLAREGRQGGAGNAWHLGRARAYNRYVMFRFLVHICVGAAEVVPGE